MNASAQLFADFTSSTTEGCAPLVVQFTDASTGSPTKWFWDLGNGVTSLEQNPSAIYFSAGIYTIKLLVKNSNGEDSVIKTNYITVHSKPTVDFTANPDGGCTPLDVSFTDLSNQANGTISNWLWDFGDGVTSPEQNPVHTYNILDSFTVTLEVTNNFGCKQISTKPSYIKITGNVKAGFNYTYTSACKAPVTILFTNTSTSNQQLFYNWDFGDGSRASTAKNPVHTYTNAGSYEVTLIVTNSYGCISVYKQTINVGTSKTDFGFWGNCINAPVTFVDSSSPTPLNQLWDFGDGTTATGPTVTHQYAIKGSYSVTLTASFGGCDGTVTKTVTIDDAPTADFDVNGARSSCTYPVTIQFVNKSKNAKTYKWIFNSSNTSTDENPSYRYTRGGSFSVTLIAFNENGCSDTMIKKDYIQIGPPVIDGIRNLPYAGCAPQTIMLAPVTKSDTTQITFLWDFGDGNMSTNPTPSHTYNAGVYNVTLIATKSGGCTDTLFMPEAVSLGNKPKASFTGTPTNTCATNPVQFTDASTGTITDWLWNFGDNVTSSQQNPSHIYKDTGYFDVMLIVGQYQCFDSLILRNYIYVDPPVAKFKTTTQCNDRLSFQFTDNSIGATSWQWDFGDGNTSTETSPSHTYTQKGVFTVSLTVSNGICDFTARDTLNVLQDYPTIQYEFLSQNSCKFDSVKLFATNYDTSFIKTYQWNFGDGKQTRPNAADSIVYHIYDSTGDFFPILILKNKYGCLDTVTSNVAIKVNGPTAIFINKPGGCLSSSVLFKDSSTASPGSNLTTWIWNYGDGSKTDTLNGPPFAHIYNTTGTFTVLLKVIDDINCYDTASYTSLEISKPVAAFVAADTLSCSQNAIRFIDSSSGLSLTYLWQFGDGKLSSKPSPSHTYAQTGVYDVKLVIKDRNGCIDSAYKPGYVTISNAIAEFVLADSIFACPPARLVPDSNTSENYQNLLWDFGDGNTSEEFLPQHYYVEAGTFTLKLIAYGYGICSDTAEKTIIVKGPSAVYNYSPLAGCNSVPVIFSASGKNIMKYTWDFGNGVTATTIDTFINYTYMSTGRYLPKLLIEDSNGCQVAVVNEDSITVSSAQANFTAEQVKGVCDSSLFNFTNLSEILYDSVTIYKWKFGDGDSSLLTNPQHFYKKPRQYSTTLDVLTKNGCQSTFRYNINVSIDTMPKLYATLPDSACTNASVSFKAGATNGAPDKFTWLWNFGDNTYANSNETTHIYTAPGTYNVYVTASGNGGCADTIQQQLVINPLPETNAGMDTTICLGQSITLNASGANSYIWNANTHLSCLRCETPLASPVSNTNFYVTGTNNYGCKASDSVTVWVKQPANVSVVAPDTVCAGTTIELKGSGAELYKWSPANLVKNYTDSVTTSTPTTSVTYTLTGTDSKGCFTDTASAFVNVFPIPVIQLKDSVADIAAGSNFQLNATSSADVTKWLWAPAINISCTGCANPVVNPVKTTVYTVKAYNTANCYTERSVTITVWCNNDQNLYIPNTFSPNADGTNDYFYPRGKGLITIKSLRIFNRLGGIVYERTNFPANQQLYGWDGKYKGKALQPDVYVYLIEVVCENGQILTSKGNVTLLR